jgi:hypothetical protein
LFNPGHVCTLATSFASLKLYLLHGDIKPTLGEVLSSDQQLFNVSQDQQELVPRGKAFRSAPEPGPEPHRHLVVEAWQEIFRMLVSEAPTTSPHYYQWRVNLEADSRIRGREKQVQPIALQKVACV